MSFHRDTTTETPASETPSEQERQKSVKKRLPVTIASLHQAVTANHKLVSLTCYDYTTSKILDATGAVDILLVGDSLAMTVLGHPDTLSVTVDEMLHHVKAVTRGCQYAMVVADMPFLSYQIDQGEAVRNAGRFIKEGHAKAVKLEGASPDILKVIEKLTAIGIPVMGHLGFTPQSIHTLGGFKVQGKTIEAVKQLMTDALALQHAGVFSIILEMVPVEVATYVTQNLSVPTIGIGAGNGCQGQILVIDDLLGRYQDLSPRFVRHYMASATLIQAAVTHYAQDIQSGSFPDNATEAFAFPEPEALRQLALLQGTV
jgi:3-methyl-2-oxobutanoate hydroxymethyltransferase